MAAVNFHRELHFEILKVHLAVARRKPEGNRTDDVLGEIALPVNGRPEFHRPGPLKTISIGHLLERLGMKYRIRNAQVIHSWWEQTGALCLQTTQQLHWVSGIQLFLDFFATERFQGLLSPHHKVWYDDHDVIPTTVKLDVISRTTNFLRVWVAYAKGLGLNIPHKLRRPHSACLSFWTMSYRLPWSAVRLERVDRFLFRCLGMQANAPRDLVHANLMAQFEFF